MHVSLLLEQRAIYSTQMDRESTEGTQKNQGKIEGEED